MAGEFSSGSPEHPFDPKEFVKPLLTIANQITADAEEVAEKGFRDRDTDEIRKHQRLVEVKQTVVALSAAVKEKSITEDEFNTAIAALIVDLEVSSVFDDLTRLPARVVFNRMAPKVLEKAIQAGHRICVIVADADCLRETNNNLGHSVGDQLLLTVAKALKHQRGDDDVLCRMAVGKQGGADEFVWLATDTRKEEAELIREVVTRQVDHELEELGLTGLKFLPGVSLGIAEWRPERTLDELLTEAEHDLYDKKRLKKGITLKTDDF